MAGWIAVGETSSTADESITVAQFINRLATARDRVVPVVGAGLALEAGAPSGADLIHALLDADAREPDGPTLVEGNTADLFDVADALAEAHSDGWVQRCVAEAVSHRTLRPTRTLMALAKVQAGVILTTNYDLSIEIAAHSVGVRVLTATLATFAAALNDEFPGLVVVHLHGVADDPESIVLTKTSYERINADEVAHLLLKALGTRYRLMFVGHSLSGREKHIRNDVQWTTRVAYPTSDTRHLLLTHTPDVGSPAATALIADLAGLMLDTYVFHDPDQLYKGTAHAAAVIAGSAAIEHEGQAPTFAADDAHYLATPVAPAEEIAQPDGRGAYMARTWQHGETLTTHLDDTENRLLLVGAGGYGKSRELHEIAKRAQRPALYLRLGNATPPMAGLDSDVAFLQWMTHAQASDHNPSPVLTHKRLKDDAVVLLLDGLDEVRADWRADVIHVINDVVAAHPQHRWVIASRPIADTGLLDEFTAYTPVPGPDWVHRYASARGVDPAAVDSFVGAVSGLQDLFTIPVYAVSIVSSVARGESPPGTTLDLVCRLADERIDTDNRIPGQPAHVATWLDRLALLLELQARTQISESELLTTSLHADLGIAPTDELIADLAVRALLTDAAGLIGFPANVIQEARTGRALLAAGDPGLQLLESEVLVTLGVTDPDGHPVRAIRPSWVNTLELTLASAPEHWRDRVGVFDPMLAARATPTNAKQQERHRALRTLWDTYEHRRVWLDRGLSGDERDDAGALTRLAAAGTPTGFVDELKDSLTAEEPTLRAAALTVLTAVVDHADLVDYVRRAITDTNPVVRRQAALIAWQHSMTELAPVIAAQALRDDDEMASESLLDMAIALSPLEDAIRLTADAPPRLEERAWRELARRTPRNQLIAQLSGPPFRHALLDVLVSDGTRSTRNTWTAQDVADLSRVLAAQGDDSDLNHVAGLESVLSAHASAALAGRLTAPPGDYFQFHIGRLTAALSAEQLDSLADALHRDALVTDAQVELSAPMDNDAVAQASAYLSGLAVVRRTPPPSQEAKPTARDRQHQRIDNVAADRNFDALLEMPPSEVLPRLEGPARDEFSQFISERLAMLIETGDVRRMTLEPEVLVRDLGVLTFAAQLGLPATGTSWLPVALFALRWHDSELRQWCRDNYEPNQLDTYVAALSEYPAQVAAEAHTVIPQPVPAQLVTTILDVLTAPDLPEARARATVAELIDADAGDIIRAWKPSPQPVWLLSALVQLGDCEAEATLLGMLANKPDELPHWPMTYEARWLEHVQCPESAELAQQIIRNALVAGRETHDISTLFAALERICGEDVLRRYDTLIGDSDIPHAPFLYYRRKAALNALAEARAQQQLPIGSDLEERVRAVVPNAPQAAPPTAR